MPSIVYINTTTYTVSGLAEETAYVFVVYAGDAAAYDSSGFDLNVTTLIDRKYS